MHRPVTRLTPMARFSSANATAEIHAAGDEEKDVAVSHALADVTQRLLDEFPIVQSRWQPHASIKFSSIVMPLTVWVTSG